MEANGIDETKRVSSERSPLARGDAKRQRGTKNRITDIE